MIAFKTLALTVTLTASAALLALTNPDKKSITQKPPVTPKIQAAILLDVSNSMDGLIDQARAQLWNMVNTMGKVKCPGDAVPQIEIALYEYGRSSNDLKQGYVKRINSFITSLDSLSENLFSLTTMGGDEYCGHVIKSSIDELQWDPSPDNYKVIFIAGNEDFLQGDVKYTEACNKAKQKGVIVNTIYCGDRLQGIQEHWNLNAECGSGSYTNINQDVKNEEIPTPYDSLLITLNGSLNNTYLNYTVVGYAAQAKQAKMDVANTSFSKEAQIKRIKTKSNAKVYKNAEWDLVDAVDKEGAAALDKMERSALPDSLKNKSKEEIKKVVEQKARERGAAQKEIAELNTKRDAYIAAEKAKRASSKTAQTLETEVEKMIREQVKRYNMRVE
ncbi:MAG: vWA domain-containing protein [Ferruginibacter sp.]